MLSVWIGQLPYSGCAVFKAKAEHKTSEQKPKEQKAESFLSPFCATAATANIVLDLKADFFFQTYSLPEFPLGQVLSPSVQAEFFGLINTHFKTLFSRLMPAQAP